VKERVLNVLMVGWLIAVGAGSLWAQSPEDLQKRRQAVRDAMDPDSVMILRSAQPLPEVAFHQESNFYYLTGVNEPGAALILYSTRRSGGGTPAASESPGRADVLFLQPAAPLLAAIRPVKSPGEIATLTTAAGITAMAEREAMRSAKPGMFEYQIQAVVEHVFAVNGAARPGFQTIIGSGKNSCVLHWSANTRKTEAGDVVVMDIGAEYGMYTADITRTIPISGAFTTRQRQVYEIVLKANEEAIRMVGPGVNMTDINNRVNEVLSEGLIALGLIKDKSGLRRYYPGSVTRSASRSMTSAAHSPSASEAGDGHHDRTRALHPGGEPGRADRGRRGGDGGGARGHHLGCAQGRGRGRETDAGTGDGLFAVPGQEGRHTRELIRAILYFVPLCVPPPTARLVVCRSRPHQSYRPFDAFISAISAGPIRTSPGT
jgi:hypothetical protein